MIKVSLYQFTVFLTTIYVFPHENFPLKSNMLIRFSFNVNDIPTEILTLKTISLCDFLMMTYFGVNEELII